MESLFLKRDDIRNLKILKYTPDYCFYKLDNDTLLKCFNVREKTIEEKSLFLYNKGQKINLLSNYDMPENYFKSFVFVDGTLVGYAFENVYKQGFKKVDSLGYKSLEKKVELLEAEKKSLLDFHNVDITYGNVDHENILYNPSNNRVMFLNIDDAKVRNYDFDVKNVFLTDYLKHNDKNPTLVDNYLFNIHTVSYLQRVFYYNVIDWLKSGNIPYGLDELKCQRIADEMIHLDNDYKGRLFIDNQKPFIKRKTR